MYAQPMTASWLSDWTANDAAGQYEPRHEYARVVPKAEQFSHDEARAISSWALKGDDSRLIVIDLSSASDATTAAFAQLVALRRALLRDGRDLRIAGMRDRTQNVFQVNRLDGVLPVQ